MSAADPTPSPEARDEDICAGCLHLVDRGCCCCGERPGQCDNHTFVPAGCNCHNLMHNEMAENRRALDAFANARVREVLARLTSEEAVEAGAEAGANYRERRWPHLDEGERGDEMDCTRAAFAAVSRLLTAPTPDTTTPTKEPR